MQPRCCGVDVSTGKLDGGTAATKAGFPTSLEYTRMRSRRFCARAATGSSTPSGI